MDSFVRFWDCLGEPDAHRCSVRWDAIVKKEDASAVRERKNLGLLGPLQAIGVIQPWQTLRGVRASSPFQGRDADLGFTCFLHVVGSPKRQLPLWDSTGRCSVLLANNLLADSSWYSVIVQWLFIYIVPVWRVTGTHQPHNWEAAAPDLPVWRERCRRWALCLPHARGKQQFGTNYIHLDPGSKQLPKSHKAKRSRLVQGLSRRTGTARERSCCRPPALPWDMWLCGGHGSPHAYRLSAPPGSVSPSSLLQHSTEGFAWTALRCLWICFCLEANQTHSHSQAQLRRD